MIDKVPAELVPERAQDDDVLYVLDRHLQVRYGNDAWRRFAEANGGGSVLQGDWNHQAIANFSGGDKLRWQALYAALLNGELREHEEPFICPSPSQHRDFRLVINIDRNPSGDVAHLVHHVIAAGPANTAAHGGDWPAIEQDPASVVEDYRAKILGQAVRPNRFGAAQSITPRAAIGGDLLWHKVRSDGATDIVIADAKGHGLLAARTALAIVSILNVAPDDSQSVAQRVASLNRALCEQRQSATTVCFAAGLYLRLKPEDLIVELCSFGHEGPIFSDFGRVQLASGLPVGLTQQHKSWPTTRLPFAKLGRRVLTFSDGVTEQFDPQGEMFGTHRLERAFLDTRDLALNEVLENIRTRIEEFRASAVVKDDCTLLAIERLGS